MDNAHIRNPWIVWYAICMHWVWGGLLLTSTTPLGVTSINSLTHFGFVTAPYVGLMFLTVAFLAAISRATPKPVGILFILPQQLVLIVSALGAVEAMRTGIFADGTVRSIPFLVADQLPAILIAVFHILCVYTTYFYRENRQ